MWKVLLYDAGKMQGFFVTAVHTLGRGQPVVLQYNIKMKLNVYSFWHNFWNNKI